MTRKLLTILSLLLTVTQGTWAQSTSDIGKVLAADGKMYKTVAAATNAGTTASGIIAYWGAAGSVETGTDFKGIAISLANVYDSWEQHYYMRYCGHNANCSGCSYCSSISSALSANNGIAATTGAVSNNDSHDKQHEATKYARNYSTTRPGGSSEWSVPSLGQWNLILKGLTGSETNLSESWISTFTNSNVSTKITAAGGSGLNWAVYWSSTESSGSEVWCLSFNNNKGCHAINHSKEEASDTYCRAFFAFSSATAAVYTISYNANGGSGAPSSQTKDGGINLTLSSTLPTRTGYTFAGWNTAANGSGTSYASGATFTGNANTTLYAQWTANTYTVTFDKQSGTGGSDNVTATYDAAMPSVTMPTRTGYTFNGYYDATSGGTQYYTANGASAHTWNKASNTTLYAQWTENTATLNDGDDVATALATWAGKTCTVSYTRSFTADKPSTVCLPFAYATASAGGTFYTFTGITKEDGEYIATMTAYEGANLVANTPYLFKASATDDVDFGGTYAIPADLTAGSTGDEDGWKFVGTYETVSWTEAPTGIYGFSAQNVDAQGISQGEFVKVGAYVRVKPMRCYLMYKNGGENYAGARAMTRAADNEELPETISVRLVSANGELNAIGTLHTHTGEVELDGWYTLDGTKLSGKPTVKGVYINNGRKVIIK